MNVTVRVQWLKRGRAQKQQRKTKNGDLDKEGGGEALRAQTGRRDYTLIEGEDERWRMNTGTRESFLLPAEAQSSVLVLWWASALLLSPPLPARKQLWREIRLPCQEENHWNMRFRQRTKLISLLIFSSTICCANSWEFMKRTKKWRRKWVRER